MQPSSQFLSDYPFQSFEKLRYADTDRQGHINNAVFSTMFETGRTEFLLDPNYTLLEPGCAFVIAHLQVDYLAEITWPGRVDIGTRIYSVGKSSMTLEQGLFQSEKLVATGQTVIVQMNEETRRSYPLSQQTIKHLKGWIK
jgi:acyl-CoA thioester hydrolase